MADSENDSGGGGGETNYTRSSSSSARDYDRFLPIANLSRIMKKGLPGNAKISKDAKETVQCVSEFISFITGEASDKCRREKRKTINGDDLSWAVTTLGFKEYVEQLKIYLHKFREMEGEKTAGTGMARQLLHDDHHPHEYHDQRQREQLQHPHAPGMKMYGGMMMGHQHHHHQVQGRHPYLYGSCSGPF